MMRLLRYLAPNLVTSVGLLFGLLSMIATIEHRFVDAGWCITASVMLDRVDGFVARLLKATSPFGIQMDSFADAINFGVAPALLVYVSLSSVPALGFDQGVGRVLLLIACAVWVLANVFRLAKFNVVAEDAAPSVFFGIPTTLAAGLLVIWTLVLHKYSPPEALLGSPEAFEGPHLFGGLSVGISAWSYLPAAMLLGAFLMASNLPQPKLGPAKHKAVNVLLVVLTGTAFLSAFLRYMPDYMALLPTTWTVGALLWSALSPKARGLKTPSFLPSEPPADAP
ncbi:MAG: CDP-alcohol phosphatidyltransferase family protein [Myxococcota bacterium]